MTAPREPGSGRAAAGRAPTGRPTTGRAPTGGAATGDPHAALAASWRTAPHRARAARRAGRAPVADPRLVAYVLAGAGSLVASLLTGRVEVAVTGLPFLALALLGLDGRASPRVRASSDLAAASVLEGDEVVGTVHLDWDGPAELDVLIDRLPGVVPVDPAPAVGWALPALRGPVAVSFRVRAETWGRHELGAIHVRARRPGGLLSWESKLGPGPTVRVLPSPLRIDALLRPAEPRAVAGAHLARVRGPGTDLAELRPYAPGDRLRDLSWQASARTGSPWVIVHHPERTGTVVLLLDAVLDGSAPTTAALARAARAAWAVADGHLRAQDRVGLLAHGRTTVWLPPSSGRRARWMLLDTLLAVGGAAEDRSVRHGYTRAHVPAEALVVGVTTLRNRSFSRELVHHRRQGRTTAAMVIDTADLLGPPPDRIDATARRLWLAEVAVERHRLHRSGVATALVTGDAVGGAVSALRRAVAHAGSASARVGSAGVGVR